MQIHRFRKTKPLSNALTDLISDDYVVGLVEGEGCFSVAIERVVDNRPRKTNKRFRKKRPSLGFHLRPSFRIMNGKSTMRNNEEIKEKLYTKRNETLRQTQLLHNQESCVSFLSVPLIKNSKHKEVVRKTPKLEEKPEKTCRFGRYSANMA